MERRRGLFEDLMDIGLKLPLKVASAAAVVIYVGLQVVAIETQAPVTTKTLAGVGAVVQHEFLHAFAEFLQYLVPLCLSIGATVGYFKRTHSKSLLITARANPKIGFASIRWRDFERLVGEAFRQRGYAITGFAGNGPDGVVDLGLAKNGERFLVQCKHWRNRQVGVTVVRELNGVIAAQRAHGGFVVTGGEFSAEAQEFAKSTTIELIDGKALEQLIGRVESGTVTQPSAPECPRCGSAMVQRKAKQGKFAGQSFWGCQQYPKCTGIVQIY